MSLLATGRLGEKEVDVVLGEVAGFQNEGPPFLCKVRATNQCTSSPSVGEVLGLTSRSKQGATPQTGPSEEKAVVVVFGRNTEGPRSLWEARATTKTV